MSRIENNKFEVFKIPFNVRDTLKEVQQIMEFQSKQKGLELYLEIDEKVPLQVSSDQKRYRQILFNLIGNAVKFTFKGSIKVSATFSDNCFVTTVADTGVGIQQQDLSKLFKFFGKIGHTKKINRGGMGFGLTISKMILNQLGG